MNIDEALKYFKSGYELARLLNIRSQNIYKWKRENWIPLKQQHKINSLLQHKLPVDIDKQELEARLSKNKI